MSAQKQIQSHNFLKQKRESIGEPSAILMGSDTNRMLTIAGDFKMVPTSPVSNGMMSQLSKKFSTVKHFSTIKSPVARRV